MVTWVEAKRDSGNLRNQSICCLNWILRLGKRQETSGPEWSWQKSTVTEDYQFSLQPRAYHGCGHKVDLFLMQSWVRNLKPSVHFVIEILHAIRKSVIYCPWYTKYWLILWKEDTDTCQGQLYDSSVNKINPLPGIQEFLFSFSLFFLQVSVLPRVLSSFLNTTNHVLSRS